MLKSAIRQVIASAYFASHHFMKHLKGKGAILMYHRVISEKELGRYYIQPGMYVKSDVFEMQMKFLREHFTILPFAELLDIWEHNKWDNTKRYCVITFDDGWLDNYVYAYPVLKKHKIPATIFLPTSYIGTTQCFWPDKMSFLLQNYYANDLQATRKESINNFLKRYHWFMSNNGRMMSESIETVIEKCKELSDNEINTIITGLIELLDINPPNERLLLNWEEVTEMSHHGISFGSHSSSHRILTKLSTPEIQKELEESQHILRKMKSNHIPVFCYPNGDYTKEISGLVKSSGYRAGVSTSFGIENAFPEDLYGLKRIGIHNDISKTIPLFALRIAGIR